MKFPESSKAEIIANSQHIIVNGHPFYGGYNVYGPFKNREEADKWLTNQLAGGDCAQVIPLIEPWK